jgi:isopentenyl-diphosphate delta-isomerase
MERSYGQSSLPYPEMPVDVVDLSDRPIGTAARRDVLTKRADFRVVHVFLMDTEGRILLQQLSPNRDRNPLRWGASVAAYLFAGETYEEAARRRLAQELNVTDVTLTRVGKTSMLDETSIKFIEVYQATYEGPIAFDESHIAGLAYETPDAIAESLKNDPATFTPTFRVLFPFFIASRHA